MNTETQTARDVPNAETSDLLKLRFYTDRNEVVVALKPRTVWVLRSFLSRPDYSRCFQGAALGVQGSEVHAEQAPTDTSRKSESGASGCGGAEESKTHLEFSYPNGEYNNEYEVDATADGIELMDGLNLITWEWIERAYATLKKGNLDRQ